MTKEAIQKEIDCLRDVKTHLWHALIVSSGGTIALLFNLDHWLKALFLVIGTLFSIAFLNGYFKNDDRINKLIKKLKEEA